MRPQAIILLHCLMILPAMSHASCKKAQPDQIPHGANELILLRQQTVGLLRGVVSIGTDAAPASGVVVEVYRYEGSADEFKSPESLKGAKRSTACLTNENGRFAFPQLKPGRYLLRAGTVRSMGINEVYAIFKVTETGKNQEIKIRLPVGT